MKSFIYYLTALFLFFTICITNMCIASAIDSNEFKQIRSKCRKDLDFIKKVFIAESAPYKIKEDKHFHTWFENGFLHSAELIDEIRDQDDCYYAINYFMNGFELKNISLRTKFEIPQYQYPGFLSTYSDNDGNSKHVVIYKHPNVKYLKMMQLGDEIIKVNDMPIDKYFSIYMKPFYTNGISDYSKKASSMHIFIVDGNMFVPTPKRVTLRNQDGEYEISLEYTALVDQAERIRLKYQRPPLRNLKIESLRDGLWIKMPSFFLNQEESITFRGLLSSLVKFANKFEYIIFDLRGNLGGNRDLEQSVIRNLYGDKFLKTLGKEHAFNNTWNIKHRLTKNALVEFKKIHTKGEISQFSRMLNNGNDFYEERMDIYKDNSYLFTKDNDTKVKAKIIIFTDSFCSGECWMFVNEMKQIPEVLHFGLPTDIQSKYSNYRKFTTPSEQFDFFIPTQLIDNAKIPFDTKIIPSKRFDGDIRNDSAVIDWILCQILTCP